MAKKEAKVTKKENSKENKNKKSFFKGLKVELKKVVWPTPKQLLNNTVAVITIVLITAAIVFVLDFVFESMNKHGIDKIKTVIDNTSTSENTSVSEDTTTEENTTNEETAVEGQEQTTENQTNIENNAQ